MAHNMDFNKGLYPGEPGYNEWTGFEKEMKIPGRATKILISLHQINSIRSY